MGGVTLRSRLVAALLVLTTAGLVAFGVVTYQLYETSQFDRLDDQLRASPQLPLRSFRRGPTPSSGRPTVRSRT